MLRCPGRIPRWLTAAVYGNRLPHRWASPLRVLSHYFDVRPTYRRRKRALQKQIAVEKVPLLGHLHVPKTGGNYIDSLQDVLPHLNFGHVVIRRDRTDEFVPVGLVAVDAAKIEGFRLFSTVRNPLDWLVSYFYHAGGVVEGYKTPRFHEHVNAAKGFDYLINTILDREDVWPSRKFLFPILFGQAGDCLPEWINRIETLDEDLQRFAATFDRTFTPRERQLVMKKPRQPEDHYTPALRRRVEQAYAREMKLFGYDGFDLCQPIVPLTPLSRRSLHYDYVSDVLAVDGVELTREAASVE